MKMTTSDSEFWRSLTNKVGVVRWDESFKAWLVSLTNNFGVRAALGFYDDPNYEEARNAQATPDVYFPNAPDGTVAFGLGFVREHDRFEYCTDKTTHVPREIMKRALDEIFQLDDHKPSKPRLLPKQEELMQRYSEMDVIYCNSEKPIFEELQPLLITAHEFGHILQFKMGMKDDGPWQMEPHADYMAGWFVGRYYSTNLTGLERFAATMFSMGDTAFNVPDHHGTPQLRAAMIRAGYAAAKLDVKEAFEQGARAAGVPG
jgi:hypothetical protein